MRSAAALELANRTIETRVDGIGQKLNTDIAGMGVSAQTGREALRDLIEHKLEASATAHEQSAHRLREELDGSFAKMKQGRRRHAADHERSAARTARREQTRARDTHAEAVADRRAIAPDRRRRGSISFAPENAAELEKVRATVDEKLQTTLENAAQRKLRPGGGSAQQGLRGVRRDAQHLGRAWAISRTC